jgi:(E)-4-hydroxy-3-methylbut-2-enyl-diphosphate synthase
VNGPGEARQTDVAITGGGRGTHQIYINGNEAHRLSQGDIVEHMVALVEKKVEEIKNNADEKIHVSA